MSTITPEERPTFKVAHWYRCHGLLGRENFLSFQKTFSEIVTTIVGTKDEDELWKYIRSLFDFDDYADCVPINAANLSILFHPVQLFLNAIALDWNRDISIQKRIKPFVHTIGIARALIAEQLNVEPEMVAFVRNGSDPNAVINNGLTFQPGEEVIIWDENHPTGGESAWKIRKDRFPNINIVVVSLEGEQDPDKIVQKFLEKVNAKTKIVAFSENAQNSFSSAQQHPSDRPFFYGPILASAEPKQPQRTNALSSSSQSPPTSASGDFGPCHLLPHCLCARHQLHLWSGRLRM